MIKITTLYSLVIFFTSIIVANAHEIDYEPVDLGLSVKWANKNVAASSITDFGNYYAWAETFPKDEYDWTTYKYTEERATRMTKYNYTTLGATIDFLTELESMDDAATQNMGSQWRTPNLTEMNELIELCTWTWQNDYLGSGHNGFLITSNVEGFTDNSIFLPAAGHYGGKSVYDLNGGGMYWTSSLDKNSFAHISAAQLYFGGGSLCTMGYDRQIGMTIRAVYGDKKEQPNDYDISGTVQTHDYVDLGLSVQWATCNIGASNPKAGGSLYSWAETEQKNIYTIENYKYSNNGSYSSMSKYNKIDGLTLLESIDDAATLNWGNEWRIPTEEEFEELINGCDWYCLNGCIYGISKVNENVIILSTLTGCRDDSFYHNSIDDGYYWTANRGIDPQRGTAWIYRRSGGYNFFSNHENRYVGYAVRPVLAQKHNASVIEINTDKESNYLDDGVFVIGGTVVIKKGGKMFNLQGYPIR